MNLQEFEQDKRLKLPLGFFDKMGEGLRRQRVVENIFREDIPGVSMISLDCPPRDIFFRSTEIVV